MCTQQMESLLYELRFTIGIRKTKESSKYIVKDLCSVLITECEDFGIHGWAPLSELQGQVRTVFMGSEKSYLHVFLL